MTLTVAMGGGIFVDSILGLCSRTGAFPMPQLQGVPLFNPLVVPAVRAEPGYWKVHLPVELKFLGDDPEGGGALFITRRSGITLIKTRINADIIVVGTLDDFVEYGVRDAGDVVGDGFGFQGNLVVSGFGVFPRVALRKGFLLAQGEVLLCDGLVVGEGREFRWEELSIPIDPSFTVNIGHGVHVFDDAGHHSLVLFPGVLFVQDAVGFGTEVDAGKNIRAPLTKMRIVIIITRPCKWRKKHTLGIAARAGRFVGNLHSIADPVSIVGILEIRNTVKDKFTILSRPFYVKAKFAVFGLNDVVPRHIMRLKDAYKTMGILQD